MYVLYMYKYMYIHCVYLYTVRDVLCVIAYIVYCSPVVICSKVNSSLQVIDPTNLQGIESLHMMRHTCTCT